jgi:hypothetical protein
MRGELSVHKRDFWTDKSYVDLDENLRADLRDALRERQQGLAFFQQHNPFVRHIVLRKRRTLENQGLLKKIAVEVYPQSGHATPGFEGRALVTSAAFDEAYKAAVAFGEALRKRDRAAGITEKLMQQRICSSFASGLATARALLAKCPLEAEADADEFIDEDAAPDLVGAERAQLTRIIELLEPMTSDPKLETVKRMLIDDCWLEKGCIIFSQFFDTAEWVAMSLAAELPTEPVGIYAGLGKSGLWSDGVFVSVER